MSSSDENPFIPIHILLLSFHFIFWIANEGAPIPFQTVPSDEVAIVCCPNTPTATILTGGGGGGGGG